MSDKTPNLYQRLLAITDDGGAVEKAGRTNYGEKYSYHKVDDVVEHLRPLLVRHGVALLASVVEHHMGDAGTTKSGATNWRAEALVALTFVNVDQPEDRVTVNGWGEGLDTSDKGVGKAIAYALKNALLATFHLRGQPDVEAEHHEATARPSTRPTGATPKKSAAALPAQSDTTARRKPAMEAASKEGKWPLTAESWRDQTKFCVEEYGAGFADVTDDEFGELLVWIKGGGQWPDGYAPLSAHRRLGDEDAA